MNELEESTKLDSIKIIRTTEEKELYNSNKNPENNNGEDIFEKELNRPLKIQEIEKIKLLEKNIFNRKNEKLEINKKQEKF